METTIPRVATGLGWAGLLPFVAAPVAVILLVQPATVIGSAIAAYSLSIVCFLVGSWWGIGLLRRDPGILVTSNLVVITACLGFVLLDQRTKLMLQALLLAGIVVMERVHPIFKLQPGYYMTLRMRLSGVASVALLWTALLL